MKLNEKCEICNDTFSKYRCPVCVVLYCSMKCFKKHKESQKCIKANDSSEKQEDSVMGNAVTNLNLEHEEQISLENLKQLSTSSDLKRILSNPHLRTMIKTLDAASDKKHLIEQYMHEPIFVEFADECLSTVKNNCD